MFYKSYISNIKEKQSYNLLFYQIIYALISIIFYIISLSQIIIDKKLTPISPIIGIVIFSLYTILIIPNFLKKNKFYKIFLFIVTAGLAFFLVLKNIYLLIINPQLFPFTSIGILAILIHFIGLIINIFSINFKPKKTIDYD